VVKTPTPIYGTVGSLDWIVIQHKDSNALTVPLHPRAADTSIAHSTAARRFENLDHVLGASACGARRISRVSFAGSSSSTRPRASDGPQDRFVVLRLPVVIGVKGVRLDEDVTS